MINSELVEELFEVVEIRSVSEWETASSSEDYSSWDESLGQSRQLNFWRLIGTSQLLTSDVRVKYRTRQWWGIPLRVVETTTKCRWISRRRRLNPVLNWWCIPTSDKNTVTGLDWQQRSCLKCSFHERPDKNKTLHSAVWRIFLSRFPKSKAQKTELPRNPATAASSMRGAAISFLPYNSVCTVHTVWLFSR